MKHTYETGLLGEDIAAEWLEQHYGMRLLESRYKTKAGEIDLIMLDRNAVVFVEVKTRMTAVPGMGIAAVTPQKQRRIARAATLYLIHKEWLNRPVRFDVIEVRPDDMLYIPKQSDGIWHFRLYCRHILSAVSFYPGNLTAEFTALLESCAIFTDQ